MHWYCNHKSSPPLLDSLSSFYVNVACTPRKRLTVQLSWVVPYLLFYKIPQLLSIKYTYLPWVEKESDFRNVIIGFYIIENLWYKFCTSWHIMFHYWFLEYQIYLSTMSRKGIWFSHCAYQFLNKRQRRNNYHSSLPLRDIHIRSVWSMCWHR